MYQEKKSDFSACIYHKQAGCVQLKGPKKPLNAHHKPGQIKKAASLTPTAFFSRLRQCP